ARVALDDAFAALAEARPPAALLPPPREGEVVLAFQASADNTKLHAFAQTPDGVKVVDADPIPEGASDAELGVRLLDPFSAQIAPARKVRVLSYGPLAGVDLHALPWQGAPLLAHCAVEYPADLPIAEQTSQTGEEARPRGLVVADTHDDLPRAKKEAA